MTAISHFLSSDHQACDRLFALAEAAADRGEFDRVATGFDEFRHALERHFAMEETVLFPAFEARTGMTMGPTQVMRQEHMQMRALLESLAEAARGREPEAFLGDAETLLILMQQHNLKEERILYPMADQTLAAEAPDLVGQMQALG